MNILILGGFLGSGKTSVLLQLARHLVARAARAGTSVMIIENEIGDVGVDDKLLRAQGLAVKDLFSGCACCSSGGELLSDIQQIRRTYDPAWIIVECTGVAYPREIKTSLERALGVPVKILTLADASRWKRLRRAMAQLIDAQLDSADLVLLNKIDLVSPDECAAIEAELRQINPAAAVCAVSALEPLPDTLWQPIVQ